MTNQQPTSDLGATYNGVKDLATVLKLLDQKNEPKQPPKPKSFDEKFAEHILPAPTFSSAMRWFLGRVIAGVAMGIVSKWGGMISPWVGVGVAIAVLIFAMVSLLLIQLLKDAGNKLMIGAQLLAFLMGASLGLLF